MDWITKMDIKLADKNLEISIIYTPLKSCQDCNVFIINVLKCI